MALVVVEEQRLGLEWNEIQYSSVATICPHTPQVLLSADLPPAHVAPSCFPLVSKRNTIHMKRKILLFSGSPVT